MAEEQTFLTLCLRIPNLGTILFFLVFVIMIPIYLIQQKSTDAFKYYFPFLVMLAIGLTESGKPHMFKELYPLQPTTLNGYISGSIIATLAVGALLYQAITMSMHFKSVELGIAVGIITFGITFSMANKVLPYAIREGDRLAEDIGNSIGIDYPGNWHRYFITVLFIILLIVLEYFLITTVADQILSGDTLKSFNNGMNRNINNMNMNMNNNKNYLNNNKNNMGIPTNNMVNNNNNKNNMVNNVNNMNNNKNNIN